MKQSPAPVVSTGSTGKAGTSVTSPEAWSRQRAPCEPSVISMFGTGTSSTGIPSASASCPASTAFSTSRSTCGSIFLAMSGLNGAAE